MQSKDLTNKEGRGKMELDPLGLDREKKRIKKKIRIIVLAMGEREIPQWSTSDRNDFNTKSLYVNLSPQPVR